MYNNDVERKPDQIRLPLQKSGGVMRLVGHITMDTSQKGNPVIRDSITIQRREGGFIPYGDFRRAIEALRRDGKVNYKTRNGRVEMVGGTVEFGGETTTVLNVKIDFTDLERVFRTETVVIDETIIKEIEAKEPVMRMLLAIYDHVESQFNPPSTPPPSETADEEEIEEE